MNQSVEGPGVAVRRGLYAVLCSALLLFVMDTPAQAQSVMTRHVRQEVISGQARFLNRLPETQTLRIDIVLPLRDQAGLESFLQELYDPASPSYRHFIFTTGGKLALFNAIQILVDHGDEVILPVPYWVSFKDIIQYAGGTVVFLETSEAEGFRITADAIERAITPRTKAIILNSPSNPAGTVVCPRIWSASFTWPTSAGFSCS